MEPQAVYAALPVTFTAGGIVFPHAIVAGIEAFKRPRIDDMPVVPRHHQHRFVAKAWVAWDISMVGFRVDESGHEGHDLAWCGVARWRTHLEPALGIEEGLTSSLKAPPEGSTTRPRTCRSTCRFTT